MKGTKLLVVADDLTGGLDTGVQFAGRGVGVRVVMEADVPAALRDGESEVLVAVAETRHLPPSQAHDLVFRLVGAAVQAGVPHIYKKTDSALRGNIGAELSAALAASGAKALPFLPAFPRMDRVTVGGRHYIGGVPVSESAFARDPFNPVRESDVCRLIAAQTDVPVRHAAPEAVSPDSGICVVDAASDDDLRAAGRRLAALGALRVSAGCAGFAAFLPELLGLTVGEPPRLPALGQGLLVLCGSVNPITRRQLDRAERAGFARVRLAPEQKLETDWLETEAGAALLDDLRRAARENAWLIVDANDADPDNAETWAYAERRGWDLDELRRRITGALAGILEGLRADRPGLLLITGGDTLMRCLKALGGQTLEPLLELFPGVVLARVRAEGGERLVITKSGGFGEEDLLVELKRRIEENTTNEGEETR